MYELEPEGKKKFVHKENSTLLSIFGAVPPQCDRICHVTLIANWFESNTALGAIKQSKATYAVASQCRWVAAEADVVLRGPKEFADQYGTDESTMMWLKHQELLAKLEADAPLIDVPYGPTFDTKMQAAEALLPDAKDDVRQVAATLRADWQWSIAFEQHLSDRLPQLHAALERGRKQLLMRVLTHKQARRGRRSTARRSSASRCLVMISSSSTGRAWFVSLLREKSRDSSEYAQLTGSPRHLMSNNSPLERLAALLAAVGAQPDLTPERLAPSTVYDLEYRVLIVAMAFQIHAAPDKYSIRPRIQGRRLKLLQFIAMRPWLVSAIREWSLSRHDAQRSMDGEEGLRRGFISDTMHDEVMDFLVAAGALRREDSYVVPGTNASVIFDLYSEALERSLFGAELAALR